jgi:hypothetical protein
VRKTRGGLDLSQLDDTNGGDPALNASGINNALDALSLTASGVGATKIDRHPERRKAAAFEAYKEKRLKEMEDDKTLRRNQKIDRIRDEFKTHPDNPMNQVSAAYNATREDMDEIRTREKAKIEKRLAAKD